MQKIRLNEANLSAGSQKFITKKSINNETEINLNNIDKSTPEETCTIQSCWNITHCLYIHSHRFRQQL